jgi:glutathione peroxidase
MKTLTLIVAIMLTQIISAQKNIYEFSFTDIEGNKVEFSKFEGKKILIVNTASECGFTPQYKELQAVHEKFGDKVIIIGFPANNFGKQEPGTEKEISSFCEKNYGVTFLMAGKVSVKGDEIEPLFKWLTTQANDYFTGDIKWNFEKILIDEKGHVSARFRSATKPDSKKIISLF